MGEGTFLVAQWLRLHVPSARGLGSIPHQRTRSHMPQIRVHKSQLKILPAAMTIKDPASKSQHIQINISIFFKGQMGENYTMGQEVGHKLIMLYF